MASEVATVSTNDNYSLSFLLGNVGAEVERMFNWQRKGEMAEAKSSLERALNLLDRIVATDISPNSRHELLRLREVICGQIYGSTLYNVNSVTLSEYFLPFALLSRKDR